MALLTASAMDGIKSFIRRTVSFAQYKVGSSWYKVPINNIVIDNEGVVRISFMIQPAQNTATVTQVQIYDSAGNLWFNKSVSLDVSTVAEGFYYLVKLTITEVDEE